MTLSRGYWAFAVNLGLLAAVLAAGQLGAQEDAAEEKRHAAMHLRSACGYAEKGDAASAAVEVSMCMKIDPANAACRSGHRSPDRLRLVCAGARFGNPPAPEEAPRQAALRHWQAGVVYFRKRDYNHARREWSRCAKIDPGNSDCFNSVRRLDQAYVADSRSAVWVEMAPGGSPDGSKQALRHYQSGIIYFQKGDYEKARTEWVLCAQMDSSNSDCRNGLQHIEQEYGGAP